MQPLPPPPPSPPQRCPLLGLCHVPNHSPMVGIQCRFGDPSPRLCPRLWGSLGTHELGVGCGRTPAPPRLWWGSFGGIVRSCELWGRPTLLCSSALTPPNPAPPGAAGAPGLQRVGGPMSGPSSAPLYPPALCPCLHSQQWGWGPPGSLLTAASHRSSSGSLSSQHQGPNSSPPPQGPLCFRWRKGGVFVPPCLFWPCCPTAAQQLRAPHADLWGGGGGDQRCGDHTPGWWLMGSRLPSLRSSALTHLAALSLLCVPMGTAAMSPGGSLCPLCPTAAVPASLRRASRRHWGHHCPPMGDGRAPWGWGAAQGGDASTPHSSPPPITRQWGRPGQSSL